MIDIKNLCGEVLHRIPADTLHNVNLRSANLFEADLRGVDLRGANLQDANLAFAYLQGADLRGANLLETIFRDAILQGADLRETNLQDAKLLGAWLSEAIFDENFLRVMNLLPEGEFVGYKATQEGVITIEIPAEARRSNAASRKCRAEFVIPTELVEGYIECTSTYDRYFKYRLGEIARCDTWEEDRWIECGGGIHFFLTREEAEQHFRDSEWSLYFHRLSQAANS